MKLAVLALAAACTSLGPMPSTTGVSAIPSGRPGVEAQVGFVPGFYLSRSAEDQAGGAAIQQLGALFDPDRWLGLPGLILGARVFGQHGDTPGEPLIGYRRELGEGLSLAAVGYATSKRASSRLASYHGAQYGGELALDAQLVARAWFGLHAQVAASATRIVGSGTYCVDTGGNAIDCDTMDPTNNHMIDGRLAGVYPSGTLTLALDLFRRPTGVLHTLRLAGMFALGQMPLVSGGVQQPAAVYLSAGLTLTVGFGADR